MQRDLHYYGIGALARAAGFNRDDALTIAYASQYTDDSTESDLIQLELDEGHLKFDPVRTSYAGLEKAARENLISPDERVVILATGNGLKDVKSAMRSVGEPFRVKPDLADVKRVLSEQS